MSKKFVTQKNTILPIALILLLILNVYLVTMFNQGLGESQKTWVATKIFSENLKFLNSTYGPLYIFYQKILLLFNFPTFIKLEIIFNSSFFIIGLYFFLNTIFTKNETALIILVYLPTILSIESKQNLLASSFFVIYLYRLLKNQKTELLPLELIISSLLGKPFFILLIINFTVKFIYEYKKINFYKIYSKLNYLKFFLIIFYIFANTYQWKDSENNHMLVSTKYLPNINLNNPIEVGFFQYNNQFQADKKNIGHEDWHTTFPKIYGDNNSLVKLLANNPSIVINHIFRNIPSLGIGISSNLYGAKFNSLDPSIKILLTLVAFVLILKGTIFIFKKNIHYKYFVIIFVFLSVFCSVLLITNPTARYIALILPVILLLFFSGIKIILKKKFTYFLLIFSILLSTYNVLDYKEKSKSYKFYYDKSFEFFLKKEIQFKKKKIFTNEKNYLRILDQSTGNYYLGFDSVPPFLDKKIFLEISNYDYIIFSEQAKKLDDISTKQGQKYLYYIKPFLDNKKWLLTKGKNFSTLKKK